MVATIARLVYVSYMQVFLTLTGMLLLSAVGVGVSQIFSFGTWIPVIGFIACMFFLMSTPPQPATLNKRQARSHLLPARCKLLISRKIFLAILWCLD